jgi:hypothetical protein
MMSESSPSHGVPDAAFDFQLYRYTPSLFAAVISVILFAILTLLHLRKLLKARAYYFIPFTIGGACMWSRAFVRLSILGFRCELTTHNCL